MAVARRRNWPAMGALLILALFAVSALLAEAHPTEVVDDYDPDMGIAGKSSEEKEDEETSCGCGSGNTVFTPVNNIQITTCDGEVVETSRTSKSRSRRTVNNPSAADDDAPAAQGGKSKEEEEAETCQPSQNVFSPVNNIQITKCDAPSESSNCSACEQLLGIARRLLGEFAGSNPSGPSAPQGPTPQPPQPPAPQTGAPQPPAPPPQTPAPQPPKARDCAEILAAGFDTSGSYAVYPEDGQDPFFVHCDMDTAGGGWTVFQRRADGTEDFYLNWYDYKYGFGKLTTEFWLGNEKIHRLTDQKRYKLRVDLEDFEGETRYAEYDLVVVAEEDRDYLLTVGMYSGTAGDAMSVHSGMKFSTKDRDNDKRGVEHCAQAFRGGWWYNSCHHANLNGMYGRGANTTFGQGVNWKQWHGHEYSLKTTEMKILPLPEN